jgi:hypothetical protein
VVLAFATWPLAFLASQPPAGPYLAGMVLGFVVGGLGHLARSAALIALGIGIILVTTVLFLLAFDPNAAKTFG